MTTLFCSAFLVNIQLLQAAAMASASRLVRIVACGKSMSLSIPMKSKPAAEVIKLLEIPPLLNDIMVLDSRGQRAAVEELMYALFIKPDALSAAQPASVLCELPLRLYVVFIPCVGFSDTL